MGFSLVRGTVGGWLLLWDYPLKYVLSQLRFHPWSLDAFSGDEGPMNNAYPGCDGDLKRTVDLGSLNGVLALTLPLLVADAAVKPKCL